MTEAKAKSRFQIVAESSKCVGCFLCQLRCSFRFVRRFEPSAAKIMVDRRPEGWGYDVWFTEDCDDCGLCAKYCVYDALLLQRRPIAEAAV